MGQTNVLIYVIRTKRKKSETLNFYMEKDRDKNCFRILQYIKVTFQNLFSENQTQNASQNMVQFFLIKTMQKQLHL